jgi:hypothetical protein
MGHICLATYDIIQTQKKCCRVQRGCEHLCKSPVTIIYEEKIANIIRMHAKHENQGFVYAANIVACAGGTTHIEWLSHKMIDYVNGNKLLMYKGNLVPPITFKTLRVEFMFNFACLEFY